MATHRILALVLLALGTGACDTETATTAVVENAYPAPGIAVYRTWWSETYFSEPVAAGGASAQLRSVPATDFAYAVLAPGWDPASATPPTAFVLVRSKTALSASRGDTLHITIDDATFDGNCAAKQPLPQPDADFIAHSIFPGELGGFRYDAATCVMTPIADASSDAGDAAD